jgi:F-type H+-transporting ATPase subunit epsilon
VSKKLFVEIVSPEHEVWAGEGDMVIAKTVEGEIGIQPNHIPVLSLLAEDAVVRVLGARENGEVRAAAHGGFISVSGEGRISILAETAELAEDIDGDRAREALKGASESGDSLAAARARSRLEAEPALKMRVDEALAWLCDEGASCSPALLALLVLLEDAREGALVIDLIEEGLDAATQEALVERLRRRGAGARPLFLMTRSSSVLDLAAVTASEAVLLCPANHSPPMRVAPHPGAPGYEAVATCLAPPEVRARTHGMVAMLPQTA